jgi:dolichol-phosphate mannosyltransferase
MRRFALANIPERSCDVFLIDRQVVEVIKTIKEKNPNIFGLILWSGFKQIEIPYKKSARQFGKSKWNIAKKIKIFIDSFVSFSYFPIRLMSLAGIVVAFIGFLYAIVVVFNRLFYAKPIEGWTSLMVVLLVVSGVQMVMLGILGEYLWRNFDESRNRPSFIVSDKIGFEDS